MEFLLQPNVYSTGKSNTLLDLLDNMWIKNHKVGEGTLYIVSGFANYNGGVRFYPYFTQHTNMGGEIIAYIGASSSQKLSSLQVVEALINCGVEVNLVNRKRLLHAKCYGYSTDNSSELVVTSGNFTGPGMSQNGEAAVRIDTKYIEEMQFSWRDFVSQISSQQWDIYNVKYISELKNVNSPVYSLLYDELNRDSKIDISQQVTMIITLSHADTARIQADQGTKAGLGTQYFWLSKTAFDFFPALIEKNKRGIKNTYSCTINMRYIDLGITKEARVTFEADNNLDFRLGTGPFRYTKKAKEKDLALITRISEFDYELRIIPCDSDNYRQLLPYANTFIGGMGKKFGYISNSDLFNIINKV